MTPFPPLRTAGPTGRRRALQLAWTAATTLATASACHTAAPTAPPASAPTVADADPREPEVAAPHLDPARMLGMLQTLSSDDFHGRYTLSDDITRAATLVAEAYETSGVQPIDHAYVAPFSLVTGVSNASPPTLEIAPKSGKPVRARDGAFVALPTSGSGTAQGEAVFVGYAARGTDDSGRVVYDDLAGLDLKGKIAVVLLHAPLQPSFGEFFGEVAREVKAFEARAVPLREAGDLAALTKQHAALRQRLTKLARPYLHGRPLPPAYAQAPDDLLAEVRVQAFTAPLAEAAVGRPGPTFARGESRVSAKIERLVEAGVAGIVAVKGPQSFVTAAARKADALPEDKDDARPPRTTYDVPVVQVAWKEADRLFGRGPAISSKQKQIDATLAPHSGPLGVTTTVATAIDRQTAAVPNVLGMIPGTELADEIVLVGAHYDHIGRDEGGPGHCRGTARGEGRDEICNGADDNGSGTVIVVEIARALAEAGLKPKRTLVFALFAGEELGLLGSRAMADALPTAAPFDTGKIVAMINIDMVGRLRPDRGLAVGGLGSSPGWMPLLDALDTRGMPILFDSSITTRSDHASFFRHDIPVLFFFTHVHDDYHGPGDEMDAINREGMTSIAHYVLDITRAAAAGHALPFTPGDGLVGALPGDDPKTMIKRIGFAESAGTDAAAG